MRKLALREIQWHAFHRVVNNLFDMNYDTGYLDFKNDQAFLEHISTLADVHNHLKRESTNHQHLLRLTSQHYSERMSNNRSLHSSQSRSRKHTYLVVWLAGWLVDAAKFAKIQL